MVIYYELIYLHVLLFESDIWLNFVWSKIIKGTALNICIPFMYSYGHM